MFKVVSCTKYAEAMFWEKSALGKSLYRLKGKDSFSIHISFENSGPLADWYNHQINGSKDDVLIFIHDDVFIDDDDFFANIEAGLNHYHIIGVAGNKRRIPYQPSWRFTDKFLTPDDPAHLSGSIAHGDQPLSTPVKYGTTPLSCELLDGVLLAAKDSTLSLNQIFFDPRFKFHFYDMDFCRTARSLNLNLGTWPIRLTHQSDGCFGSKDWFLSYFAYLDKWGS